MDERTDTKFLPLRLTGIFSSYIFSHGTCALFAFTVCCKENHKCFWGVDSWLADILGYATTKSSMCNICLQKCQWEMLRTIISNLLTSYNLKQGIKQLWVIINFTSSISVHYLNTVHSYLLIPIAERNFHFFWHPLLISCKRFKSGISKWTGEFPEWKVFHFFSFPDPVKLYFQGIPKPNTTYLKNETGSSNCLLQLRTKWKYCVRCHSNTFCFSFKIYVNLAWQHWGLLGFSWMLHCMWKE